MHQFIIIGPIILLMILALFAIKPYMPRILPSGSHLSAFNSEIWISDSSLEVKDGITERQKMVGDVVEHILPGKTRNDIIRLLGLSSDDSNQPTLLYYLGPARGDFLRMHTESLEIFFNPSGRYEKYAVIVED